MFAGGPATGLENRDTCESMGDRHLNIPLFIVFGRLPELVKGPVC